MGYRRSRRDLSCSGPTPDRRSGRDARLGSQPGLGRGTTFFGSITIPNSATAYATHRYAIYHATGNTIWVHYRGEFDESYVIKYRIQPGD